MQVLNEKGMEKLNEIADRYRFRNTFELEQDEVYDFCHALLQAYQLGLRVYADDLDFIQMVMENL